MKESGSLSPNPKKLRGTTSGRNASEERLHGSKRSISPYPPSIRGGPSDARERRHRPGNTDGSSDQRNRWTAMAIRTTIGWADSVIGVATGVRTGDLANYVPASG